MNESGANHDFIPEGTFEAEPNQMAAIKYVIKSGRELQKQCPEIADDYRNGSSLLSIVNKYDISSIYGVAPRTAEAIVASAIKGYDGHLLKIKEDNYPGLINDEEELRNLGIQHNVDSGRRTGENQYRQGAGIHAQTSKERREVGRLGASAQGALPYTDEEITYVFELANNPAFQRRTRINAMKIAEEVNRKFHNGEEKRNPTSIKKICYRNKNNPISKI